MKPNARPKLRTILRTALLPHPVAVVTDPSRPLLPLRVAAPAAAPDHLQEMGLHRAVVLRAVSRPHFISHMRLRTGGTDIVVLRLA